MKITKNTKGPVIELTKAEAKKMKDLLNYFAVDAMGSIGEAKAILKAGKTKAGKLDAQGRRNLQRSVRESETLLRFAESLEDKI